ncbi:MAG TPA: hypothetical protein VGK73_35070 [Polyangiaceae bacterium]
MLLGCSATSTITRVREPPIEADIVGGSPQSIFVVSEGGNQYEIPRSDIAKIDYPGNVHATVGAAVLTYGIINIGFGLEDCGRQTSYQAAYCTGVFAPAVLGVGLILWGLLTHQEEVNAADDTSLTSHLRNEEEALPGPRASKTTPRRPRRPQPDTRPVTPVAVDLPEDEPGPSPTPTTDSGWTPSAPTPSAAPTPSPSEPGPVPTEGFPAQ